MFLSNKFRIYTAFNMHGLQSNLTPLLKNLKCAIKSLYCNYKMNILYMFDKICACRK